MKVNARARVNLVRRLTGTKCGPGVHMAAAYSAAEYCAPVWLNSAHD
jgi:hypothetical protein